MPRGLPDHPFAETELLSGFHVPGQGVSGGENELHHGFIEQVEGADAGLEVADHEGQHLVRHLGRALLFPDQEIEFIAPALQPIPCRLVFARQAQGFGHFLKGLVQRVLNLAQVASSPDQHTQFVPWKAVEIHFQGFRDNNRPAQVSRADGLRGEHLVGAVRDQAMHRADGDLQGPADAARDQQSHHGAADEDRDQHEGDRPHCRVALIQRRLFKLGGSGGGKVGDVADLLENHIDQARIATVVQRHRLRAAPAARQGKGFVAGGMPVGQCRVDAGKHCLVAQETFANDRHALVDAGRGRRQPLLHRADLGGAGPAHQVARQFVGGEDIGFHVEYRGGDRERIAEDVRADRRQLANAASAQKAQHHGAEQHQRESDGQPGHNPGLIQHRLISIPSWR